MQLVVMLVALVLLGRLGWQGVKYLRHPASQADAARSATASFANDGGISGGGAALDPWLRDTLTSLDQAAQSAATGNLSEAEAASDRAGSILITTRLNSRTAPPEFFDSALRLLDRAIGARPDNSLLAEHITQTRVELAELRSSTLTSPPAAEASLARVSLNGPRQITAQQTLNPASLGGTYLDATLMADTAEMLMPPQTRSFADQVTVQDLTLTGAAQTLDGIHWRNVIFIGTHLRYEGGELDLQNVRFVGCRFGFVADARGARLATAIAQGQTSIRIE